LLNVRYILNAGLFFALIGEATPDPPNTSHQRFSYCPFCVWDFWIINFFLKKSKKKIFFEKFSYLCIIKLTRIKKGFL
jgi:hypothetical protein